MRLAIADPPYPPQWAERYDTADGSARLTQRSRARRYYGDGPRCAATETPADFHPDAGEWDHPARHRALLEQLRDEYDGWAIATTMDGLDHYRPLPVPARTLVWHRPNALPTPNQRVQATLEAVILYAPRERRGAATFPVPDLLVAPVEKAGFAGAKPARWTRWVLDGLGYDPDTDTLDDLFPGSGAVAAAAAQGTLAF
jgi:hypothetical protein